MGMYGLCKGGDVGGMMGWGKRMLKAQGMLHAHAHSIMFPYTRTSPHPPQSSQCVLAFEYMENGDLFKWLSSGAVRG